MGVYQGKHKSKMPSEAQVPHHPPDCRELVDITSIAKLSYEILKMIFQMGLG